MVSRKFGTGKKVSVKFGTKKEPVSASKIFGTITNYRYRLTFWVPSHTATLRNKLIPYAWEITPGKLIPSLAARLILLQTRIVNCSVRKIINS